MIPLWLATGVIVFVSIAIFNTLQKKLVADHQPLDVAYYTNITAAAVLFPFAIYFMIDKSLPIELLGLLLLTGLLNAISFYFWPLALSKEDLGVIAPTRGLTPITVAIIEPIIFLSLDYSFELLVASLLAGLGLYIAFSQDGLFTPINKLQSKGVLLGIGSSIAISGAVLVDRFAVFTVGLHPIVYAFGIALTTSLYLSLLRIYKQDSVKLIPTKSFLPVGLFRSIALGFGVYTLTLTTGTQYNILIQLSIPLSVLLGYLFLKEKEFTIRQLIGSGVIISGVYLIL